MIINPSFYLIVKRRFWWKSFNSLFLLLYWRAFKYFVMPCIIYIFINSKDHLSDNCEPFILLACMETVSSKFTMRFSRGILIYIAAFVFSLMTIDIFLNESKPTKNFNFF
ncbi:hypothetical protein H311_01582 [Anncaliia algerae PRA109]|nr:hypothetical protein H311_01582 [Anncaliia algerae PRA109]